MALARKCHSGPCGPCFLCTGCSSKYTHPEKFTHEQYRFLCSVEEDEIEKSVCICYPCHKQIQRNINNTQFKPRWKKNAIKPKFIKCGIEGCSNAFAKKTNLANKENVEQILQQPLVSFSIEKHQISVLLCLSHYNQLYSQLNPSSPCHSCGCKPTKGDQFNRHCQHPELINMYLSLVSNQPSCLSKESIICTACYMHFNTIIKNPQHYHLQC